MLISNKHITALTPLEIEALVTLEYHKTDHNNNQWWKITSPCFSTVYVQGVIPAMEQRRNITDQLLSLIQSTMHEEGIK